MENDMDDIEASMPDSALIGQNIDDLFGEAADSLAVEALDAALASVPLPPALVLRMQRKQNRGCCTKLAWSNTGSIAQITEDGRHIEFRCMLRGPATGTWSLSSPSKTPIVASEGAAFEHIHFSGAGIDLAVVDNNGRVQVHSIVTAMGYMPAAPSNLGHETPGRGDLSAVVALHWLPTYPGAFKAPYISPATKIGGRWVTEMKGREPGEQTVHHPGEGRHALLHVSRDARLTLMYQNEVVWHATSTELETAGPSCGLLSHAAFADNGDHMLLVTHDVVKSFRLYKIAISWNAAQHTRPAGPPSTVVAPTLEVVRLAMRDHVSAQHAHHAALSDLRLIPPIPATVMSTDLPGLPTIVAVFTRVFLPIDSTQQHQEAFSIIARWQVESAVPVLHDSFAKLKPNGTVTPQPAVTTLARQDDQITSKVVLSVQAQYSNTILALCTSDGTTEFRDRLTMTSLEPDGNTNSISSLPQAGFQHVAGEHHPYIAISPDGSSLAVAHTDDSIKIKMMNLRYSWHPFEDGLSDTQALVEAAVVCLARQYSILCCYSAANDDTLALLSPDLSPELRAAFIRETCRMTSRQLDLAMWETAKQQPYAIRESVLRVIASGQYVICKRPGTQKSTGPGKFGFVYISARMICTAFAQSLTRNDLIAQPMYLHSLRGLAMWFCELLAWIVDSLITLSRDAKADNTGRPFYQAFVDAAIEKENPVLNLLFCTYTRVFLRFMSISLNRYHLLAREALPNARSVIERQQLEDTIAFFDAMPFKFPITDVVINDVDSSIRKIYNANAVPPERRTEIELSLISELTIPEELHPIIEKLVETTLPKLSEHIDLAALYFRDTRRLGIDATPADARLEWDVIRKLPIAKGAKLRVCRRCGAVTEDVEQTRETPPWLVHAQRTCVCGNYWIMQD